MMLRTLVLLLLVSAWLMHGCVMRNSIEASGGFYTGIPGKDID